MKQRGIIITSYQNSTERSEPGRGPEPHADPGWTRTHRPPGPPGRKRSVDSPPSHLPRFGFHFHRPLVQENGQQPGQLLCARCPESRWGRTGPEARLWVHSGKERQRLSSLLWVHPAPGSRACSSAPSRAGGAWRQAAAAGTPLADSQSAAGGPQKATLFPATGSIPTAQAAKGEALKGLFFFPRKHSTLISLGVQQKKTGQDQIGKCWGVSKDIYLQRWGTGQVAGRHLECFSKSSWNMKIRKHLLNTSGRRLSCLCFFLPTAAPGKVDGAAGIQQKLGICLRWEGGESSPCLESWFTQVSEVKENSAGKPMCVCYRKCKKKKQQ